MPPETTDLVARLRAPEQWRSFPDMDDDAPREAADEIERLRVELKAVGEEAERLARQYQALSGIIEAMKEKGL